MHRKRKQPVRMRDVVYEMEVTLEELCHGGAKKVRIWSEVPSGGAGGSGRERVARDIEIGLTTGMCTVSERLGFFFFFMCYLFCGGLPRTTKSWREKEDLRKVAVVFLFLGAW